jgi:hypothetical protein
MCLVTPEAAAEMLKNNTHNRKIKPGVVAKYSKEHQLGEWLPCSAGIGFDTNGVLADGQHRLQMVVQTGFPAWLLIVTGLPPASQEKIDRQARRSLYDVMTLAGVATNKEVVQWVCALLRFTRNGWGDMADAEVKAAIENHGPAIAAIEPLVSHKKGHRGIARAAINAAFILSYEKRPEMTVAFIKKFMSGANMTYDDPALKLRNHCLENPSCGGSQSQSADMKRAIYALNAEASGRKIDRLMQASELI